MGSFRSRNEVLDILRELEGKGYRYVVRDKEMNSLCCFSLKPKKYRDIESWGYVDPYAAGAIMAYPIQNTDIKEINWSNRSATLISEFLAQGGDKH